jgi:hypothetical protein
LASSKLYEYVVVLRNEHQVHVNITGLLLTFGSAIIFLRQMIILDTVVVAYLAGVLFIGGLLVWNLIRWRQGHEIYFSKALMIAGLVWTRMPYLQWLVFVFVVLAILEYQARLPTEIGFSKDAITINTLLKKKFSWSQIENVRLKDGLLTIDFTNNKLIQKEIDSGENEATEEEFNAFCDQRLREVKLKADS